MKRCAMAMCPRRAKYLQIIAGQARFVCGVHDNFLGHRNLIALGMTAAEARAWDKYAAATIKGESHETTLEQERASTAGRQVGYEAS